MIHPPSHTFICYVMISLTKRLRSRWNAFIFNILHIFSSDLRHWHLINKTKKRKNTHFFHFLFDHPNICVWNVLEFISNKQYNIRGNQRILWFSSSFLLPQGSNIICCDKRGNKIGWWKSDTIFSLSYIFGFLWRLTSKIHTKQNKLFFFEDFAETDKYIRATWNMTFFYRSTIILPEKIQQHENYSTKYVKMIFLSFANVSSQKNWLNGKLHKLWFKKKINSRDEKSISSRNFEVKNWNFPLKSKIKAQPDNESS